MAKLVKYNRNSGRAISKHNEREADESYHSNEKIDSSKTHLNYNLETHGMSYDEFIEKRKEDGVVILNRNDVNVTCNWCVTMPKNVRQEDQAIFFRKTYEFLKERYGEDNCVYATVHLDETSPHIHYCFMPVVKNSKGIERVVASKVITRIELQKFHPELQSYLTKELGYEPEILNGATEGGNKSINTLKLESKAMELEHREMRAEQKMNIAETYEANVDEYAKREEERIESLNLKKQRELKELEALKLEKQRELNEATALKKALQNKSKAMDDLLNRLNIFVERVKRAVDKQNVQNQVNIAKNENKALNEALTSIYNKVDNLTGNDSFVNQEYE